MLKIARFVLYVLYVWVSFSFKKLISGKRYFKHVKETLVFYSSEGMFINLLCTTVMFIKNA